MIRTKKGIEWEDGQLYETAGNGMPLVLSHADPRQQDV
jgi:hypothetical protein